MQSFGKILWPVIKKNSGLTNYVGGSNNLCQCGSNKIIPFIFLFIVEIFPLKSNGSFFTTGNTTYLFLLMGILVGLLPKNNSIENKV